MLEWNDERRGRLRTLWKLGLTPPQIAEDLGGFEDMTPPEIRKVVLAEVERLTNPPPKVNLPAKVKAPKAARAPRDGSQRVNGKRTQGDILDELFGKVDGVVDNRCVADDLIPPEQRRSVKGQPHSPYPEIGTGECKWPVGEASSVDFFMCGDRSFDGLPYCARHARISYTRVQTRRAP